MKTIRVEASCGYEVHMGAGLLPRLGALTADIVTGRHAAIISDENVWQYYGTCVQESLEKAGFSVSAFVFRPGENSKNSSTFLQILNFLAENKLQRTDCAIALGGGVVGDVAGFTAACYLRGITYIQVPTSLLAMVDSSVGGKTAIDLPAGKNLCGAFHQPALVLCDTDTLDTLPREHFRDGCAEILKTAILFDPVLFAELEKNGPEFDRESVISRCIEWKAALVQKDEFDHGHRQLLNLGHTVGHAIEAESGYTVSHGQAVAMGIAAVTGSSMHAGLCDKRDGQRILALLEAFGLPCRTTFAADALLGHMRRDKKARGDAIRMVIPEGIGRCRILPMKGGDLAQFLKAGL